MRIKWSSRSASIPSECTVIMVLVISSGGHIVFVSDIWPDYQDNKGMRQTNKCYGWSESSVFACCLKAPFSQNMTQNLLLKCDCQRTRSPPWEHVFFFFGKGQSTKIWKSLIIRDFSLFSFFLRFGGQIASFKRLWIACANAQADPSFWWMRILQ